MSSIRTDRLWDLSQPIRHDGPAWPEHEPPAISRNYRRGAEGANAETLRLNSHTGTHVDAPFHFDDDAAPIDRLPLSAFAGTAAFLDLRDAVEPAAEIGSGQLGDRVDLLREGDFAVLVTGWGERRANSEDFLKRWPYLGGEGARLLLDCGIAGVGIDALSIGGWGGPEKEEPSHVALLGAGKVIVEDMWVPAELIGRRCFLTAFPILLEGCGGAWTRAVAWELEED